MKFISKRNALALAAALSLSACGGGKATFTVKGTVSGLEFDNLVLTTNGMDVKISPPAKAGDVVTFEFPRQLEYGDEYAVSVKVPALHQDCTVSPTYGTGTAGQFSEIQIPVGCSRQTHTIGGSISGLTKDGLVLVNGSSGGTYTANTGATTFTFPVAVTYGTTYGVTVLTQPAGLSCSVQNGAGTMGDANISNIAVTCVPSA